MKKNIQCIVNGLPGKMGIEIVKACLGREIEVLPVCLTGHGGSSSVFVEEGAKSITIGMVAPNDNVEAVLTSAINASKEAGKIVVAIDFTHPNAANKNAELYCRLGLPFIMGTTGADNELMEKDVADSGVFSLIAPNMCKQIVAFQAMMETMALTYPCAFGNYKLEVTESHQSTKVDTSGTAKKMVEYLSVLAGRKKFDLEDIVKLRTVEAQRAFGVPEESLSGHAWHTYTLTSDDGSVMFEFKHNVSGRRTYAEGVVDAVLFLVARINDNSDKKLYNMIDVLKAGEMH